LPYDHSAQTRFQQLRVPPGFIRVQWYIEPFHFVYRLSTSARETQRRGSPHRFMGPANWQRESAQPTVRIAHVSCE
jgi:hypothetical protein